MGNTQGDILYRNATGWVILPPGTENYFLRTGGPSANPTWEPVGSGVFNPQYVLYWAVGGDDRALGTIDFPLATFDQAAINGQALIVGGASFVQLVGLGVGVDTSNVNITQSGIDVYAPGWQHNPVTGDALTVDLTGVSGPSYINVVLQSASVESGAKALNFIGGTSNQSTVSRFYYCGPTTGDVYLGTKCDYFSTIVIGLYIAAQPYTKASTTNGFGSLTQATRLNTLGFTTGAGGGYFHGPVNATNLWRYPMRKIVQLSGDITLASADSGYLYINSTSSTYTITLTDTAGQDYPFLNGYEATFLNTSTGSIAFAPSGSATLIGASSLTDIAQRANCTLTATNSWEVDIVGDSYFSPFPYLQSFWIAQNNGNDSNEGLFEKPLATVQNSITEASTTPTIIYAVDSFINAETLTTLGTGQSLSINAPATSFTGSLTTTSGDTAFSIIAYALANVTNNLQYSTFTVGQGGINGLIDNAGCTVITNNTISAYSCASSITSRLLCDLLTSSTISTGTVYITADNILDLTVESGATVYIISKNITNLIMQTGANVYLVCPSYSGITNDGTAYLNGILNCTVPVVPYAPGTGIAFDTSNPNSTVINNTGEIIPFFEYANAFWFDPNGSDLNTGTSDNEPFQNLQTALNAVTTATPTIIRALGGGTITFTSSLDVGTGNIIFISAPGYILQMTSNLPLFTGVSGTLVIEGAELIAPTGYDIVQFSDATNASFFIARTSGPIQGNLTNNWPSTSTFQTRSLLVVGDVNISNALGSTVIDCTGGNITGNVTDTGLNGDGKGYVGLYAELITGDISSTNGRLYGDVQSIGGTLAAGSVNNGLFNQALYLNHEPTYGEIYGQVFSGLGPWTYSPSTSDTNQQLVITDPNGTFTVPIGFNGLRFTVIQAVAGNATINASGNDLFVVNGGTPTASTISAPGFMELIAGQSNGIGGVYWTVSITTVAASYTPYAYQATLWVAQNNGNDSNAGTSIETPLLNPQTAITNAGNTPTKIYLVDFFESSATIATTGSSQHLLIDATSTQFTGSFTVNTDDYVSIRTQSITNVTVLSGQGMYIDAYLVDGFTQTSGGGTFINAGKLLGTFALSGGARLFINCDDAASATFTNDGTAYLNGVLGGTNVGLQGNNNISGTLGFSSFDSTLNYVQTNAAPTGSGQVLVSTGSSAPYGTQWQAPASAFTWMDVTSGTQAMAVNTGYTVDNGASLVTFILPVTAAYGTLSQVVGISSGGWSIAQNAGQNIKIGAVSTMTGTGGSLSSTIPSDQVQLLCVVADTTWVAIAPSASLTYV
jgi:hypothetical protein